MRIRREMLADLLYGLPELRGFNRSPEAVAVGVIEQRNMKDHGKGQRIRRPKRITVLNVGMMNALHRLLGGLGYDLCRLLNLLECLVVTHLFRSFTNSIPHGRL